MSSNKESKRSVAETIVHCSVLVSDTLIRMADLVTLNLLYHPGMEDRADKMEHLYENVINFIDDITSTIYHPEDKLELSINQYDPIFTHLKTVSKLMVELVSLLSQDHLQMQLQTLEYFYNLNKSILDCMSIFSNLVHSSLEDIQKFQKIRITELELGAHKVYRMLLRDLPEQINNWQSSFILYLVGEKMSSIVFHCCEASKKIYAARYTIIGSEKSENS
ncbi:MAG: hypothetical protein KAS63_07090 [Candidatus Heimdallarchaeota archaeon]|nr:hypothetical protein [Candidatus Heimdallarchaeota archaeon]MCK4955111.1 hypothetical protein [Candidatus Heimdallarchaeota archaeon]